MRRGPADPPSSAASVVGPCIIYNLFIKLFVWACLRPAAALGLSDPAVQGLEIPLGSSALHGWVMVPGHRAWLPVGKGQGYWEGIPIFPLGRP